MVSLLQHTPSEMEFARAAEDYCDRLLARFRGLPDRLLVGGVSILEVAATPIVLYYLRKGLRLQHLARVVAERSPPLADAALPVGLAEAVCWEMAQRDSTTHASSWPRLSFGAPWHAAVWWAREWGLSLRNATRRPSWAGPVDLLCVCNVPRQHDSLIPVIEQCARDDGMRVLVASKAPLPAATQVVHPHVHYVDWRALRSVGAMGVLSRACTAWRSFWQSTLNVRAVDDPYLWSLVTRWFVDKGRATLRACALADQLCTLAPPRAVIATDVADFEARAISLAARVRGVPTLCLQYGMAGPFDSEWHFCVQDLVAVMDDFHAQTVRQLGVAPERVVVTGNPRFDRYRPDATQAAAARAALGVAPDQRLMVFMSVPPSPEGVGVMESCLSSAEHAHLLDAVYRVPTGAPDWVLAVKLHPEESAGPHDRVLAQSAHADRVRRVTGMSPCDVLNAADLVITAHSTTGMEAIYLNRPLVTVNLTGRPDYDNFASSGAAAGVRQVEALVATVRRLLTDADYAAPFAAARARYRDANPALGGRGASAARIVALIQAWCEPARKLSHVARA